MKCYFYKSCRILLIFLLCFSGMVYAQTGNSAWNKSWGATTPQKDAVMSLDLNVSEKKNLNPYNDGALCTSFPQLFYPLMTRQFFCDFHEKSEDFCVS